MNYTYGTIQNAIHLRADLLTYIEGVRDEIIARFERNQGYEHNMQRSLRYNATVSVMLALDKVMEPNGFIRSEERRVGKECCR